MTSGQAWGVQGASVWFGKTVALHEVSVTVRAGQLTAVVGGDGAGKSTLLRCLAGTLRPDSGRVSSPGPTGIGYLPAGSGIYPDLTVAENLAFRATAYRMRVPDARQRAADLLATAGLTAARDRLAGNLSGGMRQKLGVIAALLHRPDLLVLDEPTTGVDPVSRSGLWGLIASAAAGGAAVMLATTYLDDAQRAGTVLVLDSGRQLAAGTAEEIVAAMPGSVASVPSRPEGAAGQLAWRRGTGWRVWCPPGTAPRGEPVAADLQDAVTVACLEREVRDEGELPATPGADGSGAAAIRASSAVASSAVASPAVAAPAGAGAGPPASRADRAAAPLAECIGVTRRFGGFTAVDDVSIGVKPGEIVGLLGANGAGKTTLIRMLLGLLPASSGRVTLLGEAPSRQTRRRIGYVPQGLGLYDDLTAAENLQFSAAVFGDRAASPRDEVPGIAGTRGVPVGRLPLGAQRRVAFAQALSHQPELLILDEPTSGVDPLGRARLWEAIFNTASAGAGVLVSTHYMEEAEECDRLIIMADGAVVAAGTAVQIVGDSQVTVIQAPLWAAAYERLADAGLPVALAGRTLRVPGVSPADVTAVLAGGSGSPGGQLTGDVRVSLAPATLEERFFELVLRGGRERVAA
jgi:ABC-2 type transport system ATP-binding protein